jgi:hypothetical protein
MNDGYGMWHVWGKRYAYRVLVWKPEGKRPHGRPKCRRKHIIKVDFHGVRLEVMDRNYVTRWRKAVVDVGGCIKWR